MIMVKDMFAPTPGLWDDMFYADEEPATSSDEY